MRRRLLLAKWGFVFAAGAASAQFPQTQLPHGQFPQGPQGPAYPVMPAAQSMPLPPLPQPPQVRPSTGLPGLPAPNQLPPLRPVGPGLTPPPPASPVARPQEIPLPQPENKFALAPGEVTLKRVHGGWQLWSGHKVLRDFGEREQDARDALRVYRDLRPTEWVTIGSPRPVVEYGLVDGRPPLTAGPSGAEDPNTPNPAVSITNLPGGALPGTGTLPGGMLPVGGPAVGNMGGPAATGAGAKVVIPIDLRTVRVEAVRGVWTLRDDANILFNFGVNKGDADQAAAAVQRYGFNRVGVVGSPAAPAMTYLFASPDPAAGLPPAAPGPLARAQLQAQIEGLNRVGIPVPGLGYVGEMIRFDPRKLEVRKDGAEWVVASGAEVIGRFGPTEWAARDAARTMADAKFTEFGTVGSAGVAFFLSNGQAPTRVPFHVQGRRFDPAALKVNQYGERFAVTENGRHLFDCASKEEGETLIRVVRHYKFDQLCHLGPTPKTGVSFLAKGR
jgi:hypothetical protein